MPRGRSALDNRMILLAFDSRCLLGNLAGRFDVTIVEVKFCYPNRLFSETILLSICPIFTQVIRKKTDVNIIPQAN